MFTSPPARKCLITAPSVVLLIRIVECRNWGGAKQNVEVENNQMYKWNDKVIWQGHHWFGSQSVGPDEGENLFQDFRCT